MDFTQCVMYWAFEAVLKPQHFEGRDMTRTLVLVRHGQSEWNLKNLFTGWRDPDLTQKGHEEAKAAGVGFG